MDNARTNKTFIHFKMKAENSCTLGFDLAKSVPIPDSVSEAAGKVKTIDKTPSHFRRFENQLAFAQNTRNMQSFANL